MPGLNVSDVVNVQIVMSPLAVPLRNFGALCIAGPSPTIDVSERLRQYADLQGVSADFSSTSPEYLAADLFFSQNPQPALLYIGRFAQTATSAVLHGGIMTATQQATLLGQLQTIGNASLAVTVDGTERVAQATYGSLTGAPIALADQETLVTTLKAISNGAFSITIDGAAPEDIGPLDFTEAEVIGDIATIINTAMQSASTKGACNFSATLGAFVLTSASQGSSSTISFAASPSGGGTDVSGLLQLDSASGALAPLAGTDGLDFTQATNLNGVATIVTQALPGVTVTFDGTRFHMTALSSGANSTMTYAGPAGLGTDISGLMRLTQATGANAPVNGIGAETPLQCVTALRSHPQWYGFTFAVTPELPISDHIAVAQFIEGANPISIYGYTTQNTDCLDSTNTTDIASQMQGLDLERTFGQFSSSSPYAVCSMYARAFTVDFEASNTTITLKFKQQPGVTGEYLTETQAATLQRKNMNVFVFYSNDVAIIQEGVMANGFFFDEVNGCDWQANRIQTDLFNALYTAKTKIPQTDAGIQILVTTVEASLAQGVVNGLVAPGQWNTTGFGQLAQGQMLPKGYYVWAPLLASQSQADREARLAPTIQCAIKLAGAVHKANVVVNVNR